MDNQQMDKRLIEFLTNLDTEMAQLMLLDLQDETKRTPQLYNSINKLLDRHKFHINKFQPDKDLLGNLASSTLAAYRDKVTSEDYN